MEQRLLGRTGVRVSSYCLGAMMFGSVGNADRAECRQIIDRSLEAGITFIDTADVYSRGESEEIVGQALGRRRDDVVLATKLYNPMSREPNHRGASRRWILRACEDSLRRLGTDYIDLYQVHRLDENTDLDETLSALSDLVRAGKVRMIGTSTWPAEWMVESQWAAVSGGHVRPRCEQPPYSLFVRGAERDVFPTAVRHGMGVIVWSPLNGGWLTGKYRTGEHVPADSRFQRLRSGAWSTSTPGASTKFDLLPALEKIAADAGVTLIELALAFTQAHPAVTSTIIGPRTLAQLESQLSAAEVTLSSEVLDAIDAVVAPGTTIDRGDLAFEPQALRHLVQRRR
ncbi:aldo/keto reductase [Nocardioides sp. BP30]|uniref:aldo/keto reductase n=1 Tax=Nocardioides sp. BP30 TaxID=3036374 RepID=UPI002469122B|nr:aldo/keto reductase [Nocardioides sp. BP30]WGL54026.1 aldo/keto reductase [Nocardioides sp. BP30]